MYRMIVRSEGRETLGDVDGLSLGECVRRARAMRELGLRVLVLVYRSVVWATEDGHSVVGMRCVWSQDVAA